MGLSEIVSMKKLAILICILPEADSKAMIWVKLVYLGSSENMIGKWRKWLSNQKATGRKFTGKPATTKGTWSFPL